jgi:hypothetical protein
MLKKIAASLAVTLGLTNLSFAASDKLTTLPSHLMCVNEQQLSATLDDFQETPAMTMISTRIIMGQEVANSTVLFVNYKERTWTLVEKISEDMYCISALGSNIDPYSK